MLDKIKELVNGYKPKTIDAVVDAELIAAELYLIFNNIEFNSIESIVHSYPFDNYSIFWKGKPNDNGIPMITMDATSFKAIIKIVNESRKESHD